MACELEASIAIAGEIGSNHQKRNRIALIPRAIGVVQSRGSIAQIIKSKGTRVEDKQGEDSTGQPRDEVFKSCRAFVDVDQTEIGR